MLMNECIAHARELAHLAADDRDAFAAELAIVSDRFSEDDQEHIIWLARQLYCERQAGAMVAEWLQRQKRRKDRSS
jgi:hypothetical protein